MNWKLAWGAVFAIVALGAVNLWLVGNPVEISPIKPVRVSANEPFVQPSDAASAAAFGDLSETMERPLFSPTRQKYHQPPVEEPAPVEEPVVAPVEPPAPTAVSADVPQLLGVSVKRGGAMALVQSSSNSNPAWLGKGADVDGWTITEIDRNSVAFTSGENRAVRSLYEKAGFRAPR